MWNAFGPGVPPPSEDIIAQFKRVVKDRSIAYRDLKSELGWGFWGLKVEDFRQPHLSKERRVEDTDPKAELAKGRVALWLSPEDLLWL